MFVKRENLPEISFISGPYKGKTEFEFENPLVEVPKPGDKGVFIGRFSEQIVICAGEVVGYKPERDELTMKGRYISFSVKTSF